MDDPNQSLRDANEELGYIEEQLLNIADRLSSAIKEAMEDIGDEARKINEIFGKNLNKSITAIAKSSDTVLKNTQKLYDGTAKVADIQKDINNLKNKELAALKNIDIASRNGLLTDIQKEEAIRELNEALGFQNSLLQEQLSLATELESKYNETTKKIGVFGGVLKGIGKIPIIGDLVDTKSALEAARNATNETGNGLKGLKAGLSNLKGQFLNSIANPANIALLVITQFFAALKKADTATGDLAKDFNLTYNNAANLREELIQIGNLSGNVALNARTLQESMVAVGKSLGSNAMLNQADLETFTELREMAGYTNEELIGIQKLTLATGGNLKDNTKQFLGTVAALNAQNKLTVNEKQLLKEVSNTSAAIKLSIGGTTKGLAEAAFQAKQFGINLDQADKIAESLLDFESSIANELSAELITGKDLNLERARLLSLNGDIAGASAEILKQVKGSAEFTKMNRIQQESLAKAVGMSREELAASLVEREALNKIGAKDAAAAKAEFDILVKKYGYDKAVTMLGDEQYATQLKQQSIQERFNKSVEKLQEIFISLAEPILQIVSPFVDVLAPVLSIISGIIGTIASGFGTILKWLSPLITALGTFLAISKSILLIKQLTIAATNAEARAEIFSKAKKAGGFLMDIGSYAVSAAKSVAGIPIVGPILAIAAGAAALASGYAIYNKVNKGDDVMSEGGYGNRTLLTPKGSIALNNNDTVIAGTNLGGKGKSNSSQSSQQDLSPLLEEMRAMRQETAKSNSKPVIVENSMDGTKFGTSVAMNTYKIQ
jgi:hypothetical protein